MFEKWRSAVDKEDYFGALFTDLSKALGSLSHKLLLTKLHVYGFSLAEWYMFSLLTEKKNKSKF